MKEKKAVWVWSSFSSKADDITCFVINKFTHRRKLCSVRWGLLTPVGLHSWFVQSLAAGLLIGLSFQTWDLLGLWDSCTPQGWREALPGLINSPHGAHLEPDPCASPSLTLTRVGSTWTCRLGQWLIGLRKTCCGTILYVSCLFSVIFKYVMYFLCVFQAFVYLFASMRVFNHLISAFINIHISQPQSFWLMFYL